MTAKRLLSVLLAFALLLTSCSVFAFAEMGESSASQAVAGDCNGDGDISMKDVLLLRKFLAGMDVGVIDTACGDANGDGDISMKDVLLLRKYLAGMDVTLATLPTTEMSATETAATEPSVTETSATETSATETSAIATSATETSVTETSATETSAAETSATETSGTETSATEPSATETSATETSATETSATETSATATASTTQPSGTIKVQMNITELMTKYSSDTQTRSEFFYVSIGETVTLVLSYPDVYHATNAVEEGTAAGWFDLKANGTAITPVITSESNTKVFATYDLGTATTDITITGEVKKHGNSNKIEDFKAVVFSVNGQSSQGGTQASQAGTQTTGKTGVTYLAPNFLTDPEADTVIDRVTLSFYDMAATQYGITFHSYETLTSPVVQYVKGDNKTATDFVGASEAAAGTEVLDGFMTYNYNPTDFTFTASYDDRNNCNGNMPKTSDYTHKAALPTLSYNTTYSYRVGGKNSDGEQVWSPIYSFKTRAENPGSNFSFIWMSDSQYDSYTVGIQNRMKNVLKAALSFCPNPDMMLHGGDFANDGGYLWGYAAQISGNEDFFSKYPLMSSSGNHDTSGGSKEIYRLINIDLKGTGRDSSQSTSTGMYYSFDYGDAHFVSLNISKDAAIDQTQLTWVTNDLKNSTKKWKFVYFHRPIYTAPRTDYKSETDKEKEQANMATLAQKLSPVFEQYGVDVVLQAHVHMYSRSYPITDENGTVGSYTLQTTNGYEYYKNPTGVVYTETATAAATTDKIARGVGSPLQAYIAKAADGKANSFAIYTVNGNTLSVDACYATDTGAVSYYDKFGIIKAS